MAGTKMASDEVVYVRLKRTLYGTWENVQDNAYKYIQKLNSIDNNKYPWGNSNYMGGITTFTQSDLYEVNGIQYPYMNAYYSWGNGYQWRVIWNENFNGDPNKLVIKAWSRVCTGFSTEERHDISIQNNHGCFLDLEEGLVYFDFHYYWSADDMAKDSRQTIKCYLAGTLTPEEF